jgi:hypothetical protein
MSNGFGVRRLTADGAKKYDQAVRATKPRFIAHSNAPRLRAAVVDLLRQERSALAYFRDPAKQYVTRLMERLWAVITAVDADVGAGHDTATKAPLDVCAPGGSAASRLPLPLPAVESDPLLRAVEAETATLRAGLAEVPERPGAYPSLLMQGYEPPPPDEDDDEVQIVAGPGGEPVSGVAGAAGDGGRLTGHKRKADDLVITVDDD